MLHPFGHAGCFRRFSNRRALEQHALLLFGGGDGCSRTAPLPLLDDDDRAAAGPGSAERAVLVALDVKLNYVAVFAVTFPVSSAASSCLNRRRCT